MLTDFTAEEAGPLAVGLFLLSLGLWYGLVYPRQFVTALENAALDYAPARDAYDALGKLPFRAAQADELWAQFWERRAVRSESEERRDHALLQRLQALVSRPNEDRRRAVNGLIDTDYDRLVRVFRTDADAAARFTSSVTVFDVVSPARGLSFDADGRRLVTVDTGGTVRWWNVASGELKRSRGFGSGSQALAFSPDGDRVVTAGSDGRAVLWSAVSGEALAPALEHGARVLAVSFSPDGQHVLTMTSYWAHLSHVDGNSLRPVASRLLPDRWPYRANAHFLDPSGFRVRVPVLPTGDSVRLVDLRFDQYEADPIEGDPEALLAEWQDKLGLKIDEETGEVVLLRQ